MIVAIVILITSSYSWADGSNSTLTFESLWQQVISHSPEIKSATAEKEASELHANRISKHWLPTLTAELKAYSTNDPGLTFFSLLGQRQVTSNDFSPNFLNSPETSFYQKGSVLLNWSLYEGGAKQHQAKASQLLNESLSAQEKIQIQMTYAQVVSLYSEFISLIETQASLNTLSLELEKIIERYQLKTKSNPVGYSGWLALQSLKNRLEAISLENQTQQSRIRSTLNQLAGLENVAWLPQMTTPFNYEEYLNRQLPSPENIRSLKNQALTYSAQSLDHLAESTKAIFLPRLGVFAQGDLTRGTRDLGTSYTFGGYLQWDLFTPTSYGVLKENRLHALAAYHRAEAAQQQASLEAQADSHELKTLASQLKLLDENINLLESQESVSKTLYRNGSISALQLSDVFSRRADTLLEKLKIVHRLIEVSKNKFTSTSDYSGVANGN